MLTKSKQQTLSANGIRTQSRRRRWIWRWRWKWKWRRGSKERKRNLWRSVSWHFTCCTLGL